MAVPDRIPRPSEGPLPVRTLDDVVLHLKLIRDELQEINRRNQKYLDSAKLRRSGNNGNGEG